MKVKIGNYTNFIGPYQIAEKILFWMDRYDDRVHNFGTLLDEKVPGLTKLCQWIHSKQKRTIKVKLDRWDSWSADHTLALVILPVLKQLRATKHGCPWTEHSDGPWYYRFTPTAEHNGDDKGSYNHERWDWIMDEMIWTFEQLVDDDDSWESRYHHGNHDIVWKPCEDRPEYSEMTKGPKDTHWWDKDGAMKHQEKINNGLRLFGRYYLNLWD